MMMRRVAVAALAAALMIPAVVQGQSWRTVTMSQRLEDNDEVRVEVEYGAGEVTLRSVDGGLLYRMNLEYDEDRYEPVADFTGNQLRLGIESIGRSISMRGRKAGSLELELARGVPMDLDLEFGAVAADIDLGGLALTNLDLSAGASESVVDMSEPNPIMMDRATFKAGVSEFTMLNLGNLNAEEIEVDAGVGSITLDFNGRWERDARVSIDMGLGSLELRVPRGLGVQLRKDSFLTSFDSEGLIKRGDVYVSPDFEDAEYRIVIDLDAAFGSVAIVWVS